MATAMRGTSVRSGLRKELPGPVTVERGGERQACDGMREMTAMVCRHEGHLIFKSLLIFII